ncbi:MAG: DNA (cytosine-5-)-methyltransferase [Nitrospirae bacterium]|nr:DNA (cytosine-5-)-methyltransferase [Nitrospirota bacterium]
MEAAKELGQRIRSLRKLRKVSLKNLAKLLKVDPAHVSRIESGKVPPSAKLLDRIAKVLHTRREELHVLAGSLPKDVARIFAEHPKEAVAVVRKSFKVYRIPEPHGPLTPSDETEQGSYRAFRLIDLFAGAGGFSLGFARSGIFRSVFANDFDPWSVKTYNANFGEHCVAGDINELLARKDFVIPAGDVVIGGPPCQGFSLLNKQRATDSRKQLWVAFMEVVKRVRPLAYVMENVSELLASFEFQQIRKMSENLGYKVVADVLNAADYGVPERRKRAIVVASRVGVPQLPKPTHADPAKKGSLFASGLLPWESVRRGIGDLPVPEGTEIRVGKADPPMDLHFGRTPTKESLIRYKCIPEGGNRFDLQRKRPDLTPGCWIRKKSGGTDLFGRLWWDRPAFTIRTEFFKPEKGRYLHPAQHRPITHREAARLQSFPDDFIFHGTKIAVAMQIGNAVPPILAQRIAESLAATLDSGLAVESQVFAAAS